MKSVRIIPLGGASQVTRNMFVYELRDTGSLTDILLVDCGVGFPDESMFGVDYLIPDISYLLDKKQYIRGLVLTHGHMDHIGALKYILPKLDVKTYAARLTSALAEADLRSCGLNQKIEIVNTDKKYNLGGFEVSFVRVTHSIPDATNLIINTPIGVFYHGSDYKFDWTPVDGKQTEVNKIVKAAGDSGVFCLLSDCVRSERDGYTLSEKIIEKSLQEEIINCRGKFIFSTFSSNISRVQQAINVALSNNRKIFFSGRSIRQATEVAKLLKYLNVPESEIVPEQQVNKIRDNNLALILTGSQGEPGSALSKMANGEHRFFTIRKGDKIIISSDPIPGNESAVNNMINMLTAQGADVIYTGINDALHVSGHGAQNDLSLMLGLTRPRYIVPIGGEYKQMIQYKNLAIDMGYKEENILLLKRGAILTFDEKNGAQSTEKLDLKNILVDGLGVGDVGNVILRDRNQLAEHGFVVIIVPYDRGRGRIAGEVDIVTRGFVFRKRRDTEKILDEAKNKVRSLAIGRKGQSFDWKYLRNKINNELERFFYQKLNRRPLIMPVVVEV